METETSVDQVVERLGRWRADAAATLDLLEGYREQIEQQRAQLENPQAVAEYLAFFVEMVARATGECERIAGGLPQGVARHHVEGLRQIAAASAGEQRRCLVFRDKCINKPLPHENLRPLLNDISITTRDQLTACADLGAVADRLEALTPPEPPSPANGRSFDRRALFTRLFKT